MQPINPYAVLASDDIDPWQPGKRANHSERHFQVRLAWSDRQRLLWAIAPLRIAIILDALSWSKSSLRYVAFLGRIMLGGEVAASGPTDAVVGLFWFALHPLALWLAWLSWRYVDYLRQIAGGTATTMSQWTRTLYRLAWLGLLASALYFIADVGDAIQRFLAIVT